MGYRDLYDSVKATYDRGENTGAAATAAAAGGLGGGGAGAGKTINKKSMEDKLFSETCKLYELCFEQQFHYGVFYAYAKLKEQECRNIGWICNMLILGKRDVAEDIVPIFASRV